MRHLRGASWRGVLQLDLFSTSLAVCRCDLCFLHEAERRVAAMAATADAGPLDLEDYADDPDPPPTLPIKRGPRDPRTSVEAFVELLKEGPQTVRSLMEATGLGNRQTKARLAEVRKRETVTVTAAAAGAKIMQIFVEVPRAPARFKAGVASATLPRLNGSPVEHPVLSPSRLPRALPLVQVAAEMLMSGGAPPAEGIEQVADVIGWSTVDLVASLDRVFGADLAAGVDDDG